LESVPGSNIEECAIVAANIVIRRRYWQRVALLAAAISVCGAPVFANEIEASAPRTVVRIGDLNLGDSRGVAAAYGRLVWAAQRVCAGADSADYWVRESAVPCIIQAVSGAIESIGAPKLTAYAQAQPLFRLRHVPAIALEN
jgi:UrcA family protein